MSITSQTVRMVADLSFSEIRPDVLDKVKLLILDHLGCMIAGSRQQSSAALTNYLAKIDGGRSSTVAGTDFKFSAPNAAHANAHAATVLSLDDSYVRMGHPGNAIIPAALAVAEQTDASGRSLTEAVVAGYELSLRLGKAMRPTPARQETVWGYAQWQVFGAATASAKVHGLDVEGIATAYGLTAWHAPTAFLGKFYDRPMNRLKNNLGWACKAGITAVDLQLAGFEATHEIFDGENGYWAMGGSDRFDPNDLLVPFGDQWHTLDVGFKPYGACRWIHTTLDCVKKMMTDDGLSSENVIQLEIEIAAEFVRRFNGPWPQDTMEAILHIPYCAALELSGKSTEMGLSSDDLVDPSLRDLAQCFELTIMQDGDAKFRTQNMTPVRVSATLKNGQQVSSYAEYPSGHPQGPSFGSNDVESKFMSLCASVEHSAAAREILAMVSDLENVSVRELMQLTSHKCSKAAWME